MYRRSRLRIGVALPVITLCGFYTKFYHGPCETWMHLYAGDIFYPLFWIFVIFFLRPDTAPWGAAAAVFLFSVAIEFTQLLSTPLLIDIRSHFIGRTLIGEGFALLDIFYYLIGCVAAYGLDGILHRFHLPSSAKEPEGH
jgi:hypothetical protein